MTEGQATPNPHPRVTMTKSQKIVPHLWYDREAKEASEFYTSVFPDSGIRSVTTLHDTPSGSVDTVSFDLWGQRFMAISAGPLFRFKPSISFLVGCQTKDEVDELWGRLSEGGTALMDLGEYPFSERYGWTEDRYGLSWQVMLVEGDPLRGRITPVLMFVGENAGKAEEAIRFYVSVFDDAGVGDVTRYGEDQEPDEEGTVAFATFTLEGQSFGALDSAAEHAFTFNEAISLMVYCEDQEEIDRYWNALSAVPEAEQCGWLKDRYGVSWQVVPARMDEMMRTGDERAVARVTAAFLEMKKFDLAELERKFEGAGG